LNMNRSYTISLRNLGTILLTGGIAMAAAPATQPANLPPSVTSPIPAAKSTLVPAPYRPWLPPARLSREPRIAPSDRQHALHPRRALDLPPLAESPAALPAAPQLEVGPPIHIVSVDPSALPVATIAAKADAGTPVLATDPTLDLAPSGALTVSPPPRQLSPAALVLPIPDPAHQAGAIPLAPPEQEAAPVTTLDRPGPTTLPTGK
jgi:hypothetical protein